ncbi:MAG: DUF2442 domain-containing protein [Coriobacteriales bacterium]|nr:DUF2442 domain-containing protein [Coriobacteriales bacterium]
MRFYEANIDTGGYAVSWNDDIDISADDLYYNGTSVP